MSHLLIYQSPACCTDPLTIIDVLLRFGDDCLASVVGRINMVSKNDEFCIKNEELCIKNKELCIKNKEVCMKNDEFCRCR